MNALPSPQPQACPLAHSPPAQRPPVRITQLALTGVGDVCCVTCLCWGPGGEDLSKADPWRGRRSVASLGGEN